ncbi:Sec14p-like phosphatidylinositol transfer family protein [Forsythia ovata]|uniref:Sec14p-like phosphatidylinositol transfer family protein n=1 Tax=Forsythia ovata TaxID=205694 RepID=A0ABD1WAQ4_9LAMI
MDQNYEHALTQMRKSVEKLGCSAQMYDDPTLMRFLIARTMDTQKAAKMFVQWMKWRASFVPLNYIPESEVPDELNARKAYLQGLSKNGCPLLMFKGSKHFPSKDQLQFKKFVVHVLDKTIASSFKGREIGNENSCKHTILSAWPNATCYICHWFFVSVWRFISRFLEKATLEKIVIVTNEEERREFIRNVGEEVLPEEYGGRAKFIALQDFVITPLDD